MCCLPGGITVAIYETYWIILQKRFIETLGKHFTFHLPGYGQLTYIEQGGGNIKEGLVVDSHSLLNVTAAKDE